MTNELSLDTLAEMMGTAATEQEAIELRRILRERGIDRETIDNMTEREWLSLCEDAAEAAAQ